MTAEDLIGEGVRLARASMFLDETPTPTGVVACWRGDGPKDYGRHRDRYRHRITFDCEWLGRHGVRVGGSVGVYDVTHDGWASKLRIERFDASLTSLGLKGGTPLYGVEQLSFPPLYAVCLYGGPAVSEWLASRGLDRTDYDAAETTDEGAAYQEVYRARCPLYLADPPAAVLGGWHTSWPDDEFYLPREMRLVVWTFRESEPWVEVFERSPSLYTRWRIT